MVQEKKIYTLPESSLIIKEWKDSNQKIIFTNGCFDILHYGHLRLLYESKKLGDKLIVALNDDKSVKRLKGKGRPIHNQEQRTFALSSIIFVDLIILFSEDTPIKIIKEINPDILTKGADYSMDEVVGKKEVVDSGGEVILIPLANGLSSSNIIKKYNYGK